jgi:nucleotide-binding universal stress UspA family protein
MTRNTDRPRIVVGIDGSAECKHALRWAARTAEAFGARLELVAAWNYPAAYGWSAVPDGWSPHDDMRQLAQETVHSVFGKNRPEVLELLLCEGNPAQVLLDQSKDALMLVVGSRGHGGFAGLLMGSVSASVAEHATCPVLVVHGDRAPVIQPDTETGAARARAESQS